MAALASGAVSNITSLVGSSVSAISACVPSVVVQKIVDTGFSFIRDRIMPDDGKSELQRLQVALPQIKSLMSIAEALREKDPSNNEWFYQFRRAVNASEDVLDEVEYKKLEDKVRNRDICSASTSRSKKQKSFSINKDTLKRLREAVTMLDKATADMDRVNQRARELGVYDLSKSLQEADKVLRRGTTSFLIETEVFGRDVEKEKIISWLKQPTEGPLSTFGIVGIGGLGKTTLAQLAYQEVRDSNHFDQTIWVCVSTDFSVEGLTRKILGELQSNNYGSDIQLNALQETLKKKIQSKKILLVLDDVWDDDHEHRSSWEKFIAPLRFAQEGSKLIFTTRMKSVSDLLTNVINTKYEHVVLEGLGEQYMQLLFNSYAFRGCSPNKCSELQAIGDQIIKMLKGSPLAAKVIGSLVCSDLNYEYWKRILQCGSLFNIDQAKNMIEVLKLSYFHLRADLQVCFRFCSIFPQNYLFDKNELIEMWMACGFILLPSCHERRPEDIGEDYFNQLLRRSFFELSRNKLDGERYVMHDLIHELAQIVSVGECCRVLLNDTSISIPSTVLHVYVDDREIERISHLENLRSLIIISYYNSSLGSLFVIPNNLSMRTLRLIKINGHRTCNKLPEESRLLHLRYMLVKLLFMSPPLPKLDEFPFSDLCKLYHLQVLEFSSCMGPLYSKTEALGLTNLVSLRHMRLPDDIIRTIPGVHKMTSLENLTFFVEHESGHLINELSTLKNLRHLCIEKIENVGNPTEAKSANLLGMKHLISLCLKWTSESNSNNPEQIADCLQPHSKLREFTIENYEGQRCPSWMEDTSLDLSSLKLINCPEWKFHLFSRPTSGLTILEIRNCPNLDKLYNLPYFDGSFGGSSTPSPSFVSLKHLTIKDCSNLIELPNLPLSLIEFNILNVGLSSLPEYYPIFGSNSDSSASSLRTVKIQECQSLTSLNGFMQQDRIDFQSLETLIISNCWNLEHLPISGFGIFVSLKKLRIEECPKLVAVNNQSNILPMALHHLTIENCGELDVALLESEARLTTLTDLCIGCANIASLLEALPEQWFLQSNLSYLEILDASTLRFLPATIARLTNLKTLQIYKAKLLEELPPLPTSLQELGISNAWSLKSLPATMTSLTALKYLEISDAHSFSMIDVELPPSLRDKEFLTWNWGYSSEDAPEDTSEDTPDDAPEDMP